MGFASGAVKYLMAVIAVLIGLLKYHPHLVFSIPKYGFILHAITGGDMPPYFDKETYKGSTEWLKPNDVIVSVAAKSGTTWMLFCAHQIRVKGDDEKYPFKDISITTPWPELIHKPGQTWDERRVQFNTTVLSDGTALKDHWDHPDYPFRIFKSHFTPDTFGNLIGGDSKVKFLAMARNGLDQVASFVPFLDKHTDSFRKLWGGFPPVDGGSGERAREVASEQMKQFMPGNQFGTFYFDYVNKWYNVKDEKNVLLLHYSDAKKDLSGTVSKLADFYDVHLSKEEQDVVVKKCSFEYMKKNTHLLNYGLPLNPNFEDTIMQNGSMTRKGTNGQGESLFSDEEKATWAKVEEEEFGDDPEKLKWARNGRL